MPEETKGQKTRSVAHASASVSIVQNGEGVLRELAQAVPLKDISSTRIQKAIADMKNALDSQDDGVAIAAPQIGVPLRIFIVSGKALRGIDEKFAKKYTDLPDHLIFINPTITKLSRARTTLDEGCLSVRWLYGKVSRANKATLQAYDEKGEKIERGASGLLAQIFQHETDHLDGILFIDKATELEEIKPENKEK